MNILLDTNVLFSGLGFRGIPGQLLEEIVRQGHTLASSEYILEELQGKIRIKYSGAQKEAALDFLLLLLGRISLDVKRLDGYYHLLKGLEKIVPDQDTPILAVGMLNDIDYLVSGDKDFIKNKKVDALDTATVVTPRQMLDVITSREF